MNIFEEPQGIMGNTIIVTISDAVYHAREKHWLFDRSKMFATLQEEMGETAEAFLDFGDGSTRFKEEIMDTIAVLIRMYEGDK